MEFFELHKNSHKTGSSFAKTTIVIVIIIVRILIIIIINKTNKYNDNTNNRNNKNNNNIYCSNEISNKVNSKIN